VPDDSGPGGEGRRPPRRPRTYCEGELTLREGPANRPAKARDLRIGLLDLIESAGVGERLPSERELAARWGVARMTVRKAIERLIEEGRLERRHGSGTYTAQAPYARLFGLSSFTEDMRQRGLTPSSKLLRLRKLRATTEAASRLQIPVGEDIFRFTRLRLADAKPMALETVLMPAAHVPDLSAKDLAGSIYDVLWERYRITTASARTTITPVLPNARSAAALGIPPSQPCLHIDMTDLDHSGRTIMVADCLYRGDRYQLTIDLAAPAFPTTKAGVRQ
jgi:GntR family transcriptional regulator